MNSHLSQYSVRKRGILIDLQGPYLSMTSSDALLPTHWLSIKILRGYVLPLVRT